MSGDVLTDYDVVFNWLPRHHQSDHPDLTQVLNISTQMTEDEDEQISDEFLLRNYNTGVRVTSGTVLHFHTNDPHKHPLPHPDLLRLHAAISRVVRCAGASGEIQGDDYCGEEEEDEDPL